MSNNTKLESLFDELTFTDIFETFDEEYLIKLASTNPEQLNRMCIFLTLDNQLRLEKSVDIPIEKMN